MNDPENGFAGVQPPLALNEGEEPETAESEFAEQRLPDDIGEG